MCPPATQGDTVDLLRWLCSNWRSDDHMGRWESGDALCQQPYYPGRYLAEMIDSTAFVKWQNPSGGLHRISTASST